MIFKWLSLAYQPQKRQIVRRCRICQRGILLVCTTDDIGLKVDACSNKDVLCCLENREGHFMAKTSENICWYRALNLPLPLKYGSFNGLYFYKQLFNQIFLWPKFLRVENKTFFIMREVSFEDDAREQEVLMFSSSHDLSCYTSEIARIAKLCLRRVEPRNCKQVE